MKRRSVLVTGARGFVGGALAKGFADLGWEVIGLDRTPDRSGQDSRIHWISAELGQPDVSEGLPAVDVVIHAAWITADPATLGITSAQYAGLNLRPLLSVLEYAARTVPDAFVFLSSSGVFDAGDATEGLTDCHRPTGTSPYAVTKRAGELLVGSGLAGAAAAHVVRLGYVYGPGEMPSPSRERVSLVSAWMADARAGRTLTVRADSPRRDWTFAPDLAKALTLLVDSPPAERAVHLGSPHVEADLVLASFIGAQTPAAATVTVPPEDATKPPMVPSDIPALRGYRWTTPSSGVRALMAGKTEP